MGWIHQTNRYSQSSHKKKPIELSSKPLEEPCSNNVETGYGEKENMAAKAEIDLLSRLIIPEATNLSKSEPFRILDLFGNQWDPRKRYAQTPILDIPSTAAERKQQL